MLEQLKQRVLEANLLLPHYDLVTFTWGNVSGIDRESGLVVIKPSGVSYEGMTAEDMVVVNLDGQVVEGKWKPSSDTATHVEHRRRGPYPFELRHQLGPGGQGHPLLRHHPRGLFLRPHPLPPMPHPRGDRPGLRAQHGPPDRLGVRAPGPGPRRRARVPMQGPFAWGKDPMEAVHNAVVMEECAKMAYRTELIDPQVQPAPQALQDKHYFRKHGKNAYYGQG